MASFANLKNTFLKILIGCLVAAAALAVAVVLAGHFNSLLQKALFTIVLVALHALISFGFILNNERQATFDSLPFFSDVAFIIIVLSFITSLLGVWSVLPAAWLAKLYALYFVLGFAALHGEVLSKTRSDRQITTLVGINYLFMAAVVALLVPVILSGLSANLGSLYYRLLAALGIIDATMTMVVVILYKIYLSKHPEQVPVAPAGAPGTTPVPAHHRSWLANFFMILFIGYIGLQVLGFIFMLIVGAALRGTP